jgi:hypothetical protein
MNHLCAQYGDNVCGWQVKAQATAVQVILGAEPTFPKDAVAGVQAGHEGESTAAKRLIKKMIALYGEDIQDSVR